MTSEGIFFVFILEIQTHITNDWTPAFESKFKIIELRVYTYVRQGVVHIV